MKSILVTGGAGFIGSNFVEYFANTYPDIHLVNLDALTYASDYDQIKPLEALDNYTFVKGDIRDKSLIKTLFDEHDFHGVIHLAAESHVDNSIEDPELFLQTNILGTFNILHAAKSHWMTAPHVWKEGYEHCRFLHVSTDEVYGSLGETGLFSEETKYAPNSPYSASKASSDFIVRAYAETYGMNVVVTNCSNNYGPKQHTEKLIPKIIHNALAGKNIPIYGDGSNVRDWLYVLDHCKGIALAFFEGKAGEHYNIGGRNERTNNDIVHTICRILDDKMPRSDGSSYTDLITYVDDRSGHDKRYAIDATKIETELGWKAEETFDSGIVKTVEWFLSEWNTQKGAAA